jgi:hypothetical protein
MPFIARCVILADRQQASEFTLRSGVGLEGYGGETGDFSKPLFELLANL